MRLREYLERRRRVVNAALEDCLPGERKHPDGLVEAMRYSVFAGGKRIRPILLMAAAEASGGDVRTVLPFACAVEMIHTYSLIHDDLPAMDDDELRRGKPTCHVRFGEALAILAGDALLTEAFVLMLESVGSGMNARRVLRAAGELARASGVYGMVGGQAADLRAEGQVPDLPTVEFIHVRKTGALLNGAVRAGAILAGARAGHLRQFTRYGECLGLAFQVVDDILDAEGSTAVTGKVTGRDCALGKMTFPAVMGLPAARQRAEDLLAGALEALESFPAVADPLREIARFVVARAGQAGTRTKRRGKGLAGSG